jgi:predicted component of type VI protein secretion system
MIVTDGETARITCVSEGCVAINDRVVERNAEVMVRNGDHISLGDMTVVWKCIPASAEVASIATYKPNGAGAWVWRTFRRGTALVTRKSSVKPDVEYATPCADIPHLHVFDSAGAETVERLEAGDSGRAKMYWRIGSAPDCQVRLNQSGVSALHATLANDGDTWSITDEISVNGVYVNGTKSLKAFLNSGDVIHIAGTRLLVHLTPQSERIRLTWLITCISFAVTCVAFVLIWWWLKR